MTNIYWICILIISYIYFIIKPKYIKKIAYEDINFKTGDMILMHTYKNNNFLLIGSYWSHVGIVYIDHTRILNKGKPVIFEACRTSKMKVYKPRNRNGIFVTDLYTRLSKYSGKVVVKKLDKPIKKNIQDNFISFMCYSSRNMIYNDNIFSSGIQKKLGVKLNNNTNCGELCFLSLIKLGLIDVSMYEKKILHHLLFVVNINKLNDNFYHKPLEIVFNPF